jgi:hypothetical protein
MKQCGEGEDKQIAKMSFRANQFDSLGRIWLDFA